MNKRFTQIGLSMLLAAASLPAVGAEPIFSFDFEDQSAFNQDFTVTDANNDGTKWKWASYNTGSRPYTYALVYYWNVYDYNDMMTTKATYHLEPGHAYKLSYDAWTDQSDDKYPGSTLAIGYFSEGNPEGISAVGSVKPVFINKYQGIIPASYEHLFEVPAAGNYGFVIMANGKNSGGACIDNIVLVDAGSPNTPGAPVEVAVAGGADFALTANVTVSLPSKTVTGSALAADGITKLEIYKGETLVHTATSNLTPGGEYTWTDNAATEGVNTYRAVVYNGELVSESTEGSAYIGPMTPTAPTSAAAAKVAGGKVEISWMAPDKSAEGQPLQADLISYKVWRVVDGEPTLLNGSLKATTYTDTYSSETIVKVSYRIEAQYSGRASEAVETNELSFGAYGLPFEESFADGVLPAGWEITTSGTGYYAKQWEVKSRMTSSPSAESYDGDGGMLTYNSYSASRDLWSQAITPEINIKGLATPVVEFQFYHSSSSSGSDKVILEISKDGAPFEEIPDAVVVRNEYGKNGWTAYQFPLAAYNDANTIRLSFKAVSAYGADMAIDAIKLYTAKAWDLEATAIEGVASVSAGEDADFKFTVTNVAFAEVPGDDYEVDVYVNGNLYDTLAGQTIAPNASAEFEFAVPTHAGHEDSGVTVYAEVKFDNDEDTSNNISQEITAGVETYAGTGVAEVRGEVDGDTLRLLWDGIEVEDYEPMTAELNLDGEDYYISKDDYTKDKTVAIKDTYTDAEGRVWRSIDADGKVSDATYNLPSNAKAFMYTSAEMTGNSFHKDYSGDSANGMFIAIAPKEGEASDYLITPVMPGSGDHILEFMGKSYSGACLADFTVEYSTTDELDTENLAEQFVAFGEKVHIENTYRDGGVWRPYTYHLPREAKYIAIHFISENDKATEGDWETGYYEVPIYAVLCLDNIKVTSTPMDAPTYNVYYREYEDEAAELRSVRAETVKGGINRHNEEAIAEAQYEVALPGVTTDFHVSTVYPAGETSLSDAYHYNVATGVVEVAESAKVSVRVEGNTISVLAGGERVAFDVYVLDGAQLAAGVETYSAAAGVYVVKTGKTAATVIVK